MLLSYTVISACTSPRNSIWFNRLFFLLRGWDLGMKLIHHGKMKSVGCLRFLWSKAGTVGGKFTLKVEVTLLAHWQGLKFIPVDPEENAEELHQDISLSVHVVLYLYILIMLCNVLSIFCNYLLSRQNYTNWSLLCKRSVGYNPTFFWVWHSEPQRSSSHAI